jgi:hypothetical protein
MAGRREAVRALTAVDALGGTEHIVLTRHEGRSWAGVTPAGLTNQTGARRITSLFVLDADHAWTTYGGITDAAAQTVDSTGDAPLAAAAGDVHHNPPPRRPAGVGADLPMQDRIRVAFDELVLVL